MLRRRLTYYRPRQAPERLPNERQILVVLLAFIVVVVVLGCILTRCIVA